MIKGAENPAAAAGFSQKVKDTPPVVFRLADDIVNET